MNPLRLAPQLAHRILEVELLAATADEVADHAHEPRGLVTVADGASEFPACKSVIALP